MTSAHFIAGPLRANGYKTTHADFPKRWVTLARQPACSGATLRPAQNPTLQGHPDDYVRADIEYGARLYEQHCFGCHGATGDGVAGVDLRSGKFRNAEDRSCNCAR